VANKNQQAILMENGATIVMPPWFQGAKGWGNLALPDVYVADAVQQYPEGTKYEEGDRKFRYIKYIGKQTASTWIYSSIGETDLSVCMGRFLFNSGFPVTYAATYTYGLIDTDIVEVDTLTLAVERVDDFYSGGIMTGYSSTNKFFTRRILAHDYSATKTVGGSAKTHVGTMKVDQNLVSTFSSMALSLTTNPWKRVTWRSGDADHIVGHTVGAAMCNNTPVNYWMWVQTKGWMGSGLIAADYGGAEERETIFTLRGDGSINASLDQTGKMNEGYPVIGYYLPSSFSETGSGQDDSYPIIWIDIGID